MLELGQPKAAPQGGDILDVTEAEFATAVIEHSMQTPVIVDFWAAWCGPCKQLTPMLEQEVATQAGAVRLAKIDVDQNQQLAAQLRIQSIPTLYVFWQGQPVDAVTGGMGPAECAKFVKGVAALAGDGGLGEAVAAAEEMLEQGAATDAAQTFAAILGEDPANAPAFGGLVRAHVAMGELDRAQALLDQVPEAAAGAPEVEAARAQLALARQAEGAGPVTELRAAVETDPADPQARYDLAAALLAGGETEAAVDELLELFRRDREWNDGAARAQLMTVFDSLKPQDPIALKGRRRLSSMIFA